MNYPGETVLVTEQTRSDIRPNNTSRRHRITLRLSALALAAVASLTASCSSGQPARGTEHSPRAKPVPTIVFGDCKNVLKPHGDVATCKRVHGITINNGNDVPAVPNTTQGIGSGATAAAHKSRRPSHLPPLTPAELRQYRQDEGPKGAEAAALVAGCADIEQIRHARIIEAYTDESPNPELYTRLSADGLEFRHAAYALAQPDSEAAYTAALGRLGCIVPTTPDAG